MKIKAPGRLWFAVLLNFFISIMGGAAFLSLIISGNWPKTLGTLHPYNLVVYVGVTGFLYVSCVRALLGRPYGRQLMLLAVLVTYGINFFQSVHLIYLNFNMFNEQQHAQSYFMLSVIVVELWVNFWALESNKTRHFFAMKARQS